jgi:signal transduction histidine kinase
MTPTSATTELATRMLQTAYLILLLASLLASVLLYSLIGTERSISLVTASAVFGIGLFLARRGYLALGRIILLGCFLGVATFLCVIGGGVRDIAFLMYPVIVMTAALMVRGPLFIAIATLTLVIATAIPAAEVAGWFVAVKDPEITAVEIVAVVIIVGIASLTSYLLSRDLHENLRHVSEQREDLLRHQDELEARSAELQASERRWRSLVENMPGAILTVQPSGTVERVDGFHRSHFEGAEGRPIPDLFDSATQQDVLEALMRTGVRRAPASCRASRMGASGVRWYDLRFGPVVGEKDIETITVIAVDISDRVRADEAVYELNAQLEGRVEERTRALSSANQELEAFSYTVSHDLRAPLRHVLGYLALLRQEVGGSIGEAPTRYIETIERSARRMATLIHELLQLSRVSRTELHRELLDVGGLVESVIDELEPDARGRDISWTIGTLPTVSADPGLLRQVFVNLIGNALKFTRGCETAKIRIESVPATNGTQTILVEDNGAGFDMQYAPKLFGMFQRLHTGEEFEGTGLGLAIVRRILQRHGGSINGVGAPGRGATFTIHLPDGR